MESQELIKPHITNIEGLWTPANRAYCTAYISGPNSASGIMSRAEQVCREMNKAAQKTGQLNIYM